MFENQVDAKTGVYSRGYSTPSPTAHGRNAANRIRRWKLSIISGGPRAAAGTGAG